MNVAQFLEHWGVQENPFRAEQRLLPVQLTERKSFNYTINVSLPTILKSFPLKNFTKNSFKFL